MRKHQEKPQRHATQEEDSERKVTSLEKILEKLSQVRIQDVRTGQDVQYHLTGTWANQELADKELSQPPGSASSPRDSSTWLPNYPNPALAGHPMGSDPTPTMEEGAYNLFPGMKSQQPGKLRQQSLIHHITSHPIHPARASPSQTVAIKILTIDAQCSESTVW